MGKLREKIVKLFKSKFFPIFLSQVVYKIAAFCSSIFLARVLIKSDYGLYSYCNNIISIFLLLNGLGSVDAVMQMGCENDGNAEMQAAYSFFGLKIGLITNFCIAAAVLLYALVYPMQFEGAQLILAIMSIQPILMYLNNFNLIQMRVYRQDKMYSIQNAISGVLICVGSIVGAVVAGITGVAIAQAVAYVIIVSISILFSHKKLQCFKIRKKLETKEKRSFLLLCLSFMAVVLVSHLLTVMDVYVLGAMLKDEEIIANYKVASTIPSAMAFLPNAVMIFAYPYFVRRRDDYNWIKNNSIVLIISGIIVYGLIALSGIFLASWILETIYGYQYIVSTKAFRILLLAFIFNASINITISNIIISKRKVILNVIVSIVMGLCNVGLNVLMIKNYNMIGAAYATLISIIIGAFLYLIILIVLLVKQKRSMMSDEINLADKLSDKTVENDSGNNDKVYEFNKQIEKDENFEKIDEKTDKNT